jgi:hypothetical protein
MDRDPPDIERPSRPVELTAIALTGILAGVVVGAAANAVNGLVSPTYFITILRWQNVEDVWRASAAQGIFEGLAFGFVFSMIFTIATGIITSTSCTYSFAFKHLCGVVAGAFSFWTLGGLGAMGLATLSPEFYRRAFIGVPEEFGAMLGYAWVGGSIWGVQFGGFLCVVLGIFFLRANWRRHLRGENGRAA